MIRHVKGLVWDDLLVAILLIAASLIASNLLFSVITNTTAKPVFAVVKSNPDLDVTYIERTPRYSKYCVQYPNGLPTLCPGTENLKRWPDVGENIVYTAHIINKGLDASSSATYRWLVDEIEATSGSLPALIADQEVVASFSATFPESVEKIKFEISFDGGDPEISYLNNFLNITSHDLTISYWVEKPLYDLFNNTQNMLGTYSFEDWMQAHFAKINQRFQEASYSATPNGIIDRVRVDKVVVAEELDGPNSLMKTDEDEYLIDGRWQSTDGDPTNARGLGGEYQNYLNTFINQIDWGLNHEVTHQLGIIDLYRMGIKPNDVNAPNGGVLVTDINNQQVVYNNLKFPVFEHTGLMGGGETAPYFDGTFYESHTAGGLNSHTFKRRGFFGEYLFDTPQNNYIKVLDSNGVPMANATIKLYQKDTNSEDVDNIAEFTGTTDSNGLVLVTNRSASGAITATGHTLRSNPFGQIDVVGRNGTMITKITKNGAEGYGFYRLHDLNLQYWLGNTTNGTVEVKSNYPKIYKNLVISGVTTTPSNTTASIKWTTDFPGTSRVAYGTSSTNLSLSTPLDNSLVTSHTANLTGLRRNTRYYYRVYSKNPADIETASTVFNFRTK